MSQPLPRISVITPSLNQGQFLRRTIESVLSQNYPDLEYFVLDGGSTDNSVEILKEYSQKLTYWVSEPDGGQPQAINKGLQRATGSVICYINSDDWYPPDALLKVGTLFASRPELDWVIGGCLYAGDHISEIRRCRLSEDPARWVGEGPWLPQASSFWSRRAIEKVGQFRTDMHFAFDSEFAVRLLFGGYRPLCVEEVLANRWLHEDCKTVSSSEKFILEEERFLSLFAQQLTPTQAATARVLRIRGRLSHYQTERQWPQFLDYFFRLCRLSPRSAFSFLKSLVFAALFGDRVKTQGS